MPPPGGVTNAEPDSQSTRVEDVAPLVQTLTDKAVAARIAIDDEIERDREEISRCLMRRHPRATRRRCSKACPRTVPRT